MSEAVKISGWIEILQVGKGGKARQRHAPAPTLNELSIGNQGSIEFSEKLDGLVIEAGARR